MTGTLDLYIMLLRLGNVQLDISGHGTTPTEFTCLSRYYGAISTSRNQK